MHKGRLKVDANILKDTELNRDYHCFTCLLGFEPVFKFKLARKSGAESFTYPADLQLKFELRSSLAAYLFDFAVSFGLKFILDN
jgi:hypothetical protein